MNESIRRSIRPRGEKSRNLVRDGGSAAAASLRKMGVNGSLSDQ